MSTLLTENVGARGPEPGGRREGFGFEFSRGEDYGGGEERGSGRGRGNGVHLCSTYFPTVSNLTSLIPTSPLAFQICSNLTW